MSQGTRCRQLAEYVVFESPLNTAFATAHQIISGEPECTRFISDIPTVWDQTLAVDGTIGEYIVMARKKDDGLVYRRPNQLGKT